MDTPWLERSPLRVLRQDRRDHLLALARTEAFSRREVLWKQSSPVTHLGLVIEGIVKLEREVGGVVLPLGHRGAGELLAQDNLGPSNEARETATAMRDGRILMLPRSELRSLVASEEPFREAVLASFLARTRAVEERLDALAHQSVESRLREFLIDSADRFGTAHEQGVLIEAPFTHLEIATHVGSTRETVTLLLGKLKREGLLAFSKRRVVVRNRDALAQNAGG